MSIRPRVIVVQMGARHDYAIPRMLHAREALAGLVTDLCWSGEAGGGSGPLHRWLRRRHAAVARRTVEGVPAHLVHRSVAATLLGRISRPLRPADAYGVEDIVLGWHARRIGVGDANLVYTMFGGAEPFLRHARRQGLKIVSDVMLTPAAHRIELEEHRGFPDWGPPPFRPQAVARLDAKVSRMIALSDILLCPSQTVLDGLGENPRFDPRKARVLSYGMAAVTPQRSTPTPGRVLFAGNASLRKGIHYLAVAAAAIRAAVPAAEVVVAGGVSAEVARHEAARSLTFLGHLGRDAMLDEYRKADVLVLPTLAEGSAGVVYEALAAGLPVVTTRSAGSVVRDGHEGYIVPERDVGAIAQAVTAILRDRPLRDRFSAAALRTAALHSESAWGDRLFALLSDVVNA